MPSLPRRPLSCLNRPLLRLVRPSPSQSRPYARAPPSRHVDSDKPRTLEKPARFNPPSHGSRRVRPRTYPGPRLSEQEAEAQKTRRYPNMMPPEGSFMHWFLTNRAIHMWITLSILTSLAGYTLLHSFVSTTAFRDELPSSADFVNHPLRAPAQAIRVYKKHVKHESEKVQEKRQRKIEDARKRKEFMREHGVEPGFLTGSWMSKFGTVEGDKFREELEERKRAEEGAAVVGGGDAVFAAQGGSSEDGQEEAMPKREKKRVKKWLGIWE